MRIPITASCGCPPITCVIHGPVPEHETLIEIPEDVLRMYARRYEQQEER